MFCLLFLNCFSIVAFAKPTICSITINSSDEINLFKKHHPADQYNYVELTDNQFINPPAEDTSKVEKTMFRLRYWFKNSCENLKAQNINQCDIVVMSGHYQDTGAFYGLREIYDHLGLKLELEMMEYYSFAEKCTPFFQKPREVYLFGCQTLGQTGVGPNNSTPFIESISPKTDLRMKQLFPNAQVILGFKGLAPEGKTVAPFLNRLLSITSQKRFEDSHFNYETLSSNWDKIMSQLGTDKYGVKRSSQTTGIIISNDEVELKNFKIYKEEFLSVYHGAELNQKNP